MAHALACGGGRQERWSNKYNNKVSGEFVLRTFGVMGAVSTHHVETSDSAHYWVVTSTLASLKFKLAVPLKIRLLFLFGDVSEKFVSEARIRLGTKENPPFLYSTALDATKRAHCHAFQRLTFHNSVPLTASKFVWL